METTAPVEGNPIFNRGAYQTPAASKCLVVNIPNTNIAYCYISQYAHLQNKILFMSDYSS